MASNKEATARLYRTVSLIVAVAIVGISILILVLERPPHESSLTLILGLTANALFAGAVTAVVFNSLSLRESEQRLDLLLERVLREVFQPLRSSIETNAISGYRFNTHLTAAPASDPYPDYAIQLIRFSYTRKALPPVASIICMSSMDDDALDPYDDPYRYLMRWQVDDTLSPSDPNIFRPLSLMADGQQIEPTIHTRVSRGAAMCEYRYRIPRSIRNHERNRVELAVSTRQYSADSQVNLKTNLFATVVDAEFSCTIDSSIRCRRLSVAANVAGLGPRGDMSTGLTYPNPHGTIAAHARFSYPLQAGTSVTFYLDRGRGNAIENGGMSLLMKTINVSSICELHLKLCGVPYRSWVTLSD